MVPLESASDAGGNFTFVDWLPSGVGDALVNQEEIVATRIFHLSDYLEVSLLVVETLLLVAGDMDFSTLASSSLAALEVLDEGLVTGCDHLVKGELQLTDKVMAGEVLDIIAVVNVIDHNFVVLSLLEVIWHFKALHPLGV